MSNENKKTKEREELHRAIWAIAEDLRGSVDGWDFKNYVLGTMFYRYISENFTNYINQGEVESGNATFDYSKLNDEDAEIARKGLVEEKGFFILPSELFCNVQIAANSDKATFTNREGQESLIKDNLNEFLEIIFDHIENSAVGTESEGAFEGLFADFDVNSNKLGATVNKRNETLKKLLDGIANMDLGDVKHHDIDAFGDAYEFLMTMYASNAGKSGGEFFTPSDVSELLTKLGTVGKKYVNKVYDPACGSGSLLLKAEKTLGKNGVRNGFYGQEINITTYNLCRINMFLHDVGYDKFDIACEDTLVSPQHLDDGPFDLIVSNPPYSIKWEGNDNPILQGDERYNIAGVLAPKSKADMAFIMHSLYCLSSDGTAAIVCFPGVLYRSGAEQKIRKYLVDNNRIDAVIQLPDNLFFGTGIATCIMILKKNKFDNNVLFIDASQEYIKVSTDNRLSEENTNNIVNAYVERKNIDHFCSLVSHDAIEKNRYNLAVSAYVEKEDNHENVDIEEVNLRILEIADKEEKLRTDINSSLEYIESVKFVELINNACPDGVEYHKLGDLGKFYGGISGKSKEDFVDGNECFISYMNVYSNPAIIQDVEDTVRINNGEKQRTLQYCDVCFTGSSETPDECGISSVVTEKPTKPLYLNSFCFFFRPDNPDLFNPHFLKHLFRSRELRYQISKTANGVTRFNVSKQLMNDVVIPVPPLHIQNEIAGILDSFTELEAKLSSELEFRRKQYENYRDNLLSFSKD